MYAIPMVTNPRLTTLPMTTPAIAATMFLAMGFMITLISVNVSDYPVAAR